MRAAVYAKFSTDLQSAASLDDQVPICRKRIERDGHNVAQVYSDRAISGPTLIRPGIQAMARQSG
jgi:site-specific DNA recombinase